MPVVVGNLPDVKGILEAERLAFLMLMKIFKRNYQILDRVQNCLDIFDVSDLDEYLELSLFMDTF